MRIRLPATGSFRLRARFAGPTGGLARGATVLIVVALGLALLLRLDRLRAPTATQPY
jgi:hypothetical protein